MRDNARTRVLRAETSASEEVGTLEMIGPNRPVRAMTAHSLTDSLSAANVARGDVRIFAAPGSIRSRLRHRRDRGARHSLRRLGGRERLPHRAPLCSS